jgi:hypothetical protein
MRNLKNSRLLATAALTGALLIGCAGKQATQSTVPVAPPKPKVAELAESPRDRCLRSRTGIQECLIENVLTACKDKGEEERAGCMDEQKGEMGLEKFEFPGETRNLSVVVRGGDEVLSLTVGEFVLVSIAKIEAVSVDESGVDFRYSHLQSETDSLEDMNVLVQASFRVNFDGSTSGDIHAISGLEIWNLSVERVAGGTRVSFSTADNRITVRQ